jgi:hypothetical protein
MRCGKAFFVLVGIPVAIFSFWSVGRPASIMVEKNLFAQDRKPPPPETASSTPQAKTPGLSVNTLQLDGVMIHGDNRKALIRFKGQVPHAMQGDKAKSPYLTLKEGERVGDFQVVKIEPKSVSLEKDGQVTVLSLFAEGKVVPPVPAAPANNAHPVATPQPTQPHPAENQPATQPGENEPSTQPQVMVMQPAENGQPGNAVMPPMPAPGNGPNQPQMPEAGAPQEMQEQAEQAAPGPAPGQ